MKIEVKPHPELIQLHRNLAGMKVLDAAAAIGVDKISIYNWEAGKYPPSEDNLKKMAEVYGKDIEDFYLTKVSDLRHLATATIKDFLKDPEESKYQKSRISTDALRLQDSINELVEEKQLEEHDKLSETVKKADNGETPDDVDYGSVEEGEYGEGSDDDMPPEMDSDENSE